MNKTVAYFNHQLPLWADGIRIPKERQALFVFNLRLSLLISICLTFTFSNECKSQNVREIFLIAKSFRGKAVLVYNRPFGDKTEIANDTISYKVAPDGISVITSQLENKLEDCLFYQIDSTGTKHKLTILSNEIIMSSSDSTRLKDQVGIFIFGTIGSCNPNEPESFCYSDFYVGSLNAMPKYYTPDIANKFMALVESKAKWRRQ